MTGWRKFSGLRSGLLAFLIAGVLGLFSVCGLTQETTLLVWSVEGFEEAWELIGEEFLKMRPDVRLEVWFLTYSEMYKRLIVSVHGGEPPGVAMLHDRWLWHLAEGMLADLSRYQSEFEAEGIVPVSADHYRREPLPCGHSVEGTPVGIAWPFSRWHWSVCIPSGAANERAAVDLLLTIGQFGAVPPPGHVKDELIVIVNTGLCEEFPSTGPALTAFLRDKGVELIEPEVTFPEGFLIPGPDADFLGRPRLFHLRVIDDTSEYEKVAEFSQIYGVEADFNYLIEPTRTPDEWRPPVAGLQWNFHNSGPPVFPRGYVADVDIDAPEMWNIRVNGSGAIVAVIDSGYDDGGVPAGVWGRRDLGNPFAGLPPPHNLWVDPREDVNRNGMFDPAIDNDSRDADRDGLIDDVIGWDFGDGDNDPHDAQGHGTAVASVIAALANSDGLANDRDIAGTCWNARLMILKVSRDEDCKKGMFYTWPIIRSYIYAVAHGAKVLNCSFGGEFDIVEYLVLAGINLFGDVLVVAAAGNSGTNNNGPNAVYPASYNLPNIISVGALKWNDNKARRSNFGGAGPGWFGRRGVDLLAPGVDIVVHNLGAGTVAIPFGTSFAVAQVSGVAALIWSQAPALGAAGVKAAIVNNVDCRPIVDDPPGAAPPPFTIACAGNDSGVLNGFKALISVLPRVQRLRVLLNKLMPGVLPPGWNISTIKEVLVQELRGMLEEGLCGLELRDLIEAIENLPDEMPEGGIPDDVLERVRDIISRLENGCSGKGGG